MGHIPGVGIRMPLSLCFRATDYGEGACPDVGLPLSCHNVTMHPFWCFIV